MGMWSRLRRTFRGDSHAEEIQEEIDFHLEMDAAAGGDPRSARLRLGNPARIQEETRAAGIYAWLESVLQDVRYSLRQFRKAPGLFLAVAVSLAIGLGSNIAVFSLIDAAVLRPLPVADPDQLLQLGWRSDRMPEGVRRRQGFAWPTDGDGEQGTGVSVALFRALAERQTGLVSLIGAGGSSEAAISITATVPAEQVRAIYVSANFFEGLGVTPVLGRSFLDEEDRPGRELAIVVSHRFWSSRLGADAAAVGRTVHVNNVPARIVGVAPSRFFGLTVGEWIDVYAPLASRFTLESNWNPPPGGENAFWWVQPVARLAPGVSGDAAAAAMTPLFRNLAAQTTGTQPQAGLELIARPARRGLYASRPDENVAPALKTLMLLVGVLLLIVCLNVANLLLSRSVKRRRESAVRLALGAGRARLFRQHLIESGMVAILGGAAGLVLGSVLARSIHTLFQTGRDTGDAFAVLLDWRVSAYAAGISAITALIFGLAPAWTAARSKVNDSLKSQARSILGGGHGLPKLLVSIQFALCFAALVAAGLLGRSLENLYSTDLGFNGDKLAYATVNPNQAGYPQDRIGPYLERVQQELAAIPGVLAVAPLREALLQGGQRILLGVSSANGPQPRLSNEIPNPAASAVLSIVGPGLIETLGIPVLAGRTLETRDRRSGLRAVVIDQRFAEVFFPGQTPVGQRFGFDRDGNPRYEVVGLVANARHAGLREDASPTMYELLDPERVTGGVHFAIRSRVDPATLAVAVRRAIGRVDPSVPLAEFHTQSGLIDRLLRTERLLALLSGAFSLAALALAAVGLGGLLAYVVARRTNEIGIRMALGATGGQVRRMVLGDSLRMVGLGVLIGVPATYAVGRYLESLLFGLDPLDPFTAAMALIALIAIAGMASLLPALRAAAVSPMKALREE